MFIFPSLLHLSWPDSPSQIKRWPVEKVVGICIKAELTIQIFLMAQHCSIHYGGVSFIFHFQSLLFKLFIYLLIFHFSMCTGILIEGCVTCFRHSAGWTLWKHRVPKLSLSSILCSVTLYLMKQINSNLHVMFFFLCVLCSFSGSDFRPFHRVLAGLSTSSSGMRNLSPSQWVSTPYYPLIESLGSLWWNQPR